MGAFYRVVDKVKSIRFKNRLDTYDIDRYRYIISKVFSRLDEYFTKTGLYNCNDYDHVIDRILIDREYVFELSRNMPHRVRGRFQRYTPFKNGSVKLNAEHFYEGVETESTLCHEVIHLLTTGNDIIVYQIPKGQVELVLPDNYSLKAGYKKVTKNGKSKTEILTYADVSHNGFFKEGLTELLRQRIYTIEESKDSYPLQTSFIRLMNFVTDVSEDKVLIEFLHGDLESYRKYFGQNYRLLQATLDDFMKEYHALELFEESKDLQKAYDIVLSKAFHEFYKTKPTMDKLFEYIDQLTKCMYVCDKNTLYNSSILCATRIFKDAVSADPNMIEQFKEKYYRLIELKANSRWYQDENHLKLGFRITGLSNDIFLCPSRYSTMGIVAIMYNEPILSNFLVPKNVGASSTMKNCSPESSPLQISRPSEDTLVYSQGDVVRKVTIKDGKCFVYDENNKNIDVGYLAQSHNNILKEKQYGYALDNMNKFISSCISQTDSIIEDDGADDTSNM